MKKILVLILLFVSTATIFAVNDDPSSGCQGVHNLDNLFVEVYWKEGSTWYKIPDSEMDAIYPWRCMLNNSCGGGGVPWGESFTCYISGHANNKVTVSASSVPCRTENLYARSCWVWKDLNYVLPYNIYRIDIDSHYNWTEPYLNFMGDEGYELWAHKWADMLWTVETWIYPFPTTIYTSESRTDIRNGDVSWEPTDPNWSVSLFHKKVQKRVRYNAGGQWVYLWEDTSYQQNFRRFHISLTKGTGAHKSSEFENFEFSEYLNEEYDFMESIDFRLSQKLSVYSLDEFLKVFSTTYEEEDYSTSIVIKRHSSGEVAAIEIEKIDEDIKNEFNFILEGKLIIGVNGFRLNEFKDVEELFEYLFKEDLKSITFLDGKTMLYEIVEE